jgi:myo-inositol-1(or 4)-monophosphatase
MAEDFGSRLSAEEIAEIDAVGGQAARAAGAFLMERFHDDFNIARKGEIDLVTDVDLAAEKLIVARLKAAFPGHAILAEEMHAATRGAARTWIIDPLDGTTNYAHGYPAFCVSIGFEVDGAIEWGMVYNPNLEETFVATRGRGAFLNGAPLRVSQTATLGASLLATGFPYDIRTSEKNNLANFQHFAVRAQGIRRAGSAALDLCYVAAGRFDGFWELKLNPWDCSAGYLMVREAGGKVTNLRGDFGSIYDRECIASNVLIHEEMMAVLRVSQGASGSV